MKGDTAVKCSAAVGYYNSRLTSIMYNILRLMQRIIMIMMTPVCIVLLVLQSL